MYEFCKAAPDRMYGAAIVAPHDVSSAVEETRRIAKELGFRSILMRPNHVNGRRWSDPYYDPLWSECQKLGVPVGFHEFFFQAEDGIRDLTVTGVQTCALPI